MDLKSLSKVELHIHLDCSLSFNVVQKIDPSISREMYEKEFIAPAKCTNLAEFLTYAPKGIELMQTESQLRLVTEDLFEQFAKDNIIYVEIRFAPLLHIRQGLEAADVVEIVNAEVGCCTDEYQKLNQAFGWTAKEFLHCNLNALDAAFLPEDEKELLKQKLKQAYEEIGT